LGYERIFWTFVVGSVMHLYQTHLTAFIDFLGFSEETFEEEERIEGILNVLRGLSEIRSDAGINWEGQPGKSAFSLQPAISSFSDHIVISYPISQIRSISDADREGLSLALVNLRYLVGWIAANAFQLGFLIRGGLSLGGLHHSSGVVFGEALVDAYRLECRVSINARITFSPTILTHPEFGRLDHRLVRQDNDGQYCFEYIFPMLSHLVEEKPFVDGVRRWCQENFPAIDRQIERLALASKEHEADKWRWFRREIRLSLTRHGIGLS
jgi:hypothetical protein